MNKQRHAFLLAASLAVGVLMCGSVTAGEMSSAPDPTLQLARHGADDAPGDDHGGRHASEPVIQTARHGADDAPGDDHGGRHANEPVLQMARHGADDPAGNDRGDDRRGG